MIKQLFIVFMAFILVLPVQEAASEIFTEQLVEEPEKAFAVSLSEREIATTYPYTYEDMLLDIGYLQLKYPDIIKTEIIGFTEWGFPIYSIILGKGETAVMINGAHHGREYATVPVIMKMMNHYAQLYEANKSVKPYGKVKKLLNKVSIHFVPMLNVDGVKITQGQLDYVKKEVKNGLKKMLPKGVTLESWKSNAKGVDLNRNYPADWEREEQDYSYMNSRGKEAAEAKEVQALMDYCEKYDFKASIAYHNAGEVIFWHYFQNQKNEKRDYAYTKELSKLTGYRIIPKRQTTKPSGGFKDWFIKEYKRPAWTIEIGTTVNQKPLGEKEMLKAYEKNQYVGLWLASIATNKDIQ